MAYIGRGGAPEDREVDIQGLTRPAHHRRHDLPDGGDLELEPGQPTVRSRQDHVVLGTPDDDLIAGVDERASSRRSGPPSYDVESHRQAARPLPCRT